MRRLILAVLRRFRATPCPYCGAYTSHAPDCELATHAAVRQAYQHVCGRWTEDNTRTNQIIRTLIERHRDAAIRVKHLAHENNRLRKARYPGKC